MVRVKIPVWVEATVDGQHWKEMVRAVLEFDLDETMVPKGEDVSIRVGQGVAEVTGNSNCEITAHNTGSQVS
jgi:hypothetical protein